MKSNMFLQVMMVLSLSALTVQAETIQEILQSIADAAPAGNGDGHYVTKKNPKTFNKRSEKAKLRREVVDNDSINGTNDCEYDVLSGIEAGLDEVRTAWNDAKTASRLEGLNNKGLIREVIYTVWDSSTGDSEYCSLAVVKVYAVDGTVLELNYNETD